MLKGSIFSLTALTLAGQVASVLTQVVAASYFGSNPNMDAYVAASAAPQYGVAVLLGAIAAVAVPWITDRRRDDDASLDDVAGKVVAWMGLTLGLLALTAATFADALLHWTAPGLPTESRQLAVDMARISWPAMPCLACAAFLTGLAQVRSKFSLSAAAPVVAAVVGLLVTIVVARFYGPYALAWSTTLAAVAQLGASFFAMRHLRFSLLPVPRELGQLLSLAMPLLMTGLLIRATPLWDRALASNLDPGSLSHVNYANKIVTILSALLSVGISTIAFPSMAQSASDADAASLMRTASRSIQSLWILVAPVVAIGIVLAYPAVEAVFMRGAFTGSDSVAVGSLLQVYFIALVGMTLGTLSSRTLYSLKKTKTLALISIVETVAYLGYASWLTGQMGVMGIAWASVLLFGISLVWHFAYAYRVTRAWESLLGHSVVVTAIATVSAATVFAITRLTIPAWVQVVVGSAVGFGMYGLLVRKFCPEAWSRLVHFHRPADRAAIHVPATDRQEQPA